MSKRALPFAHGMIPMSREEGKTGEWGRRMKFYPNPGDCIPATNIVLPGQEGRALGFVCPECERAQLRMRNENPDGQTKGVSGQ